MSEARETTAAEGVAHKDMANAIRALAMDAVQAAKSGHPGMPMGMADVATVLFREVLRFDAADPAWPNRDRFVLSAGPRLDAALRAALPHRLSGHGHRASSSASASSAPRPPAIPSTGTRPASRRRRGRSARGSPTRSAWRSPSGCSNARLGGDVVDHHTYVIAGDGCLMEGISHEAISLAGHLGLGKLIVLFDDNAHLDRRPDRACRCPTTRSRASGFGLEHRVASTVTTPKADRRRLSPRRTPTARSRG